VSRTKNCWMLNWQYIQWPLGFRGFLCPSFTAPNCSLLTQTDRPETNRITAHRHRCRIWLRISDNTTQTESCNVPSTWGMWGSHSRPIRLAYISGRFVQTHCLYIWHDVTSHRTYIFVSSTCFDYICITIFRKPFPYKHLDRHFLTFASL